MCDHKKAGKTKLGDISHNILIDLVMALEISHMLLSTSTFMSLLTWKSWYFSSLKISPYCKDDILIWKEKNANICLHHHKVDIFRDNAMLFNVDLYLNVHVLLVIHKIDLR